MLYGLVVKRSRHRPFTAASRVRFPVRSPLSVHNAHLLKCRCPWVSFHQTYHESLSDCRGPPHQKRGVIFQSARTSRNSPVWRRRLRDRRMPRRLPYIARDNALAIYGSLVQSGSRHRQIRNRKRGVRIPQESPKAALKSAQKHTCAPSSFQTTIPRVFFLPVGAPLSHWGRQSGRRTSRIASCGETGCEAGRCNSIFHT